MKTQFSTIINEVKGQALLQLTSIVDETLATKKQLANCRSFKAADLWNIQRKTKTAARRRQFL